MKPTKITALSAVLALLVVTAVNTQANVVKGSFKFTNCNASTPQFKNWTNGKIKSGIGRYTYDTNKTILNIWFVFSPGSQLFSPMAVIAATNINITAGGINPYTPGKQLYNYLNLTFGYYWKITSHKTIFPANGPQTLFALSDLQQFQNTGQFGPNGVYIDGGYNKIQYFLECPPYSKNGNFGIQDTTKTYNGAIPLTVITVISIVLSMVCIGIIWTLDFKGVPEFTLTMYAIANLPVTIVAYSRGTIVNPNSGYWQLWLFIIPSIGALSKVGRHATDIINHKTRSPFVLYTAIGYVVLLLLTFFFLIQAVPYILVAIPATLALEGIFHKKGFQGIALANGLIFSQLLVYFYVYYYTKNSAYIPVVDPISLWLLIFIFVLVYIGAFVLFFFIRNQEKKDPEGEVIEDSEKDGDGSEYAKAKDEEGGAGSEVQEVNPSIGVESLDTN